ncbi:uncharacterized protein LOC129720017 [Wyeomyia smithii]|uniref:uncharacterized protein LOC129720017 n=1 Tax=Wyeomyia smithii TaxID=174621 RepID=UPI0024680FC3|nr:uncharacterized protein LOC129720017 [Wyeomyia smithii]
MAKTCAKCSDAISGIDFVTCRGYCGATFHMSTCAGVSRALLGYFTSHKKNLFWMCDNCAELFENSHFRMLSSNAGPLPQLNSLTNVICELRGEIKQLHTKPAAQFSPSLRNRWPAVDQHRPFKRPRESDAAPRSSDNCTAGSKRTLDNFVVAPVTNNTEEKFWLYISRIRPDFSTESMSTIAKAYLETDNDPVVVKLVPKDRDISTLTFVSFKIGVDPSLKAKALDPETWPEGTLFREFEDYKAQKFRVPLKTKKSTTPLLLSQASSPVTPMMGLS